MSEVGLTDNVVEFTQTRKDICPFCEEETVVPAWNKKIHHHLVVTIDEANHLHVHGPINDMGILQKMVNGIKQEMKKILEQW